MPEVTLFDVSERFYIPIAEIAHPDDISIFGTNFGEHYYSDFAGIAKKYAATTIVEIGVRYGYSGIAMCLGARAAGVARPRYRGMDAEYFSGPQSDHKYRLYRSNAVAEENFRRFASFVDGKIFTCNTQTEKWPVSDRLFKFDMASVDGDHSEEGCLHDLEGVWPMLRGRGIIIIDDTGMVGVRTAVERFIWEHNNKLDWQWYPNERGFAILRKENRG